MDKILAAHRKYRAHGLSKYMQAFIFREGPRNLTAGTSFAEAWAVLPFEYNIVLSSRHRRLTTRLQTIVIDIVGGASGQVKKNRGIKECECSYEERITRWVNFIKTIIPSKFHAIAEREIFKSLKFDQPGRVTLNFPGGRGLNPSAKSIHAMRFMSKVSTVKKKSWPRKSLLLPSSDPHCRPLLLS